MAAPDRIRVEVVYADPEREILVGLWIERGATAKQAVERSGVLRALASPDPDGLSLAVFGRAVKPDRALEPGDRVELVRALRVDPKAARARRARRR